MTGQTLDSGQKRLDQTEERKKEKKEKKKCKKREDKTTRIELGYSVLLKEEPIKRKNPNGSKT
jgi:hypothetical protein